MENDKELARIVIEWDNSNRSLPSLIADMRESVDAEIIDVKSTRSDNDESAAGDSSDGVGK